MIRRVVSHLAMVLLLSCLLRPAPANANEMPAIALAPPVDSAALPATPTIPDAHSAPLPSAVLAGVALLSITAAHSFGRRRRRG